MIDSMENTMCTLAADTSARSEEGVFDALPDVVPENDAKFDVVVEERVLKFVQEFNYEDKPLTMFKREDGELMFKIQDILNILEVTTKPWDIAEKWLKPVDFAINVSKVHGKPPVRITFVTLTGFNKILRRSRSDRAIAFGEFKVLSTIKTGSTCRPCHFSTTDIL